LPETVVYFLEYSCVGFQLYVCYAHLLLRIWISMVKQTYHDQKVFAFEQHITLVY